MNKLKGIPVAPGIVIAKAFVLEPQEVVFKKARIRAADVPREIARFEDALTKTRSELLKIRKKISEEMGREHSEIFNAHLLILEDRTLIEEVISSLRREKFNVEYVFDAIINRYKQAFLQIDDDYLKERTSDIDDIGRRVLRNLLGEERRALREDAEESVVVCRDLSPSDVAQIDRRSVLGVLAEAGGPTSHAAILARSLEIPAVLGVEGLLAEVNDGDMLILDGNRGLVILQPTSKDVARYRRELQRLQAEFARLSKLRDLPATTTDGYTIELSANIEFPSEIKSVLAHGAKGIGLYRTEYVYMSRQTLPTEEDQFFAYKTVAEKMGKDSVVVRTLDLGGDKLSRALGMSREKNSFMGWRAIRFCLERVDIFTVQLRAILRASAFGNLKIMFPMISDLTEIRKAKDILASVCKNLDREGIAYDKNIEVGIMIEVPSAALTSDLLAREVDFFSIGSNDLIQYSLAVERGNERIAHLYQPTHPAILRLIRTVIESGHRHSIWVGMCGEMAADPKLVVLLLGLGIDELSVSPVSIPEVKRMIRSVGVQEAVKIADHVLQLQSSEEICEYLDRKLGDLLS